MHEPDLQHDGTTCAKSPEGMTRVNVHAREIHVQHSMSIMNRAGAFGLIK
jgi:hypothetical protein